VGGAAPLAEIVALVRLKSVMAPEKLILIEPVVTLVFGMFAGTAVVMFPSGNVMLAVSVASVTMLQLIAIVSGAATLSVSVRVTVGSQFKLPNFVISDTDPPPKVPVEELLVVEGFVGAVVGFNWPVAVTCDPSSFNGSLPLWRPKVPVRVYVT
jgi:hypothetical protein